MSVWNGHYACACYPPLFVFNQFGDLERSALRPGNVQCRWLEWCAQAGCCALPGQGLTHLFPGGRGLCNARGLRVLGNQEPMVSPRSRPDLAARFPLILTSVKHTRFFARVSTVLCLAYASTRCIRRWSCTLRRPRCGALPPATGWRSRRRREACAPVPASTRASTLGSCAASTDGGRLARSLARRPTTPSNLMGPT